MLPPVAAEECDAAREVIEIVRVLDAASFQTRDGREVRLPALEGASPAGAHALAELVAGRKIAIAILPRGEDRWGRVLAQAWTGLHPEAPRLEADLIRAGHAHAALHARGLCVEGLLAAEAEARAARRGIWNHAPLAADDAQTLIPALGRHVVIEGRIHSARMFRDRLYVNFTRYRRYGLSLIVRDRDFAAFGIAVSNPATMLEGRRVRLRGYIEWRGGPVIVANAREPIEILDAQ